MGTGAEAEIGPIVPVLFIMLAFFAGFGPIADLVLDEAGSSEGVGGGGVHIGGEVVIGWGHFAVLDPVLHGGFGFDAEGVEGEVVWGEGEGVGEGLLPHGECLTGDAVDQVQVEVIDAGGAGIGNGLGDHGLGVQAPE